MSDSESQSQTPGRQTYRFPGLKGYLPLSEDHGRAMSTRGQALPRLISHARSNTGLDGVKNRSNRRRSSFGEDPTQWPSERRRTSDHDDLEVGSLGRSKTFKAVWGEQAEDEVDVRANERRKMSVLMTPEMRSQRLIGNSNPRYQWGKYWKTEVELGKMKKPLKNYYERCNHLIQHYLYIDRLLDSSLPHNLLQEYAHPPGVAEQSNGQHSPDVPPTITEQPVPVTSPQPESAQQSAGSSVNGNGEADANGSGQQPQKVARTKDLYRLKPEDENTPLLSKKVSDEEESQEQQVMPPDLEPDEEEGSQSRVVTVAIYINFAANTILLILKIIVVALSSSVSVLASLVDAALDFLSTAIVWTTTYLIARNDQYQYPIGRRRLEPVGVLVFSVIMITAFVQVAIEGITKISGKEHELVRLTIPAIAIMASTVVIKGLCWLWCRLIRNSSVQALAQDAMTDVVFNIFSIIFPLVGFYAGIWWLDPLGGVLLSLYVIINWSRTSSQHIRNLTGAAATADERNILLYLTMRFAKSIKQIQGLQAYHSGDKLNVEVDIVLDEHVSLRDSHDLAESLQYVLESVPNVDRAFVHCDYASYNLPSHMRQD